MYTNLGVCGGGANDGDEEHSQIGMFCPVYCLFVLAKICQRGRLLIP
jgi:hypothetical protein